MKSWSTEFRLDGWVIIEMPTREIKVPIEDEQELYNELSSAMVEHRKYDGYYIMQYSEQQDTEGMIAVFLLREADWLFQSLAGIKVNKHQKHQRKHHCSEQPVKYLCSHYLLSTKQAWSFHPEQDKACSHCNCRKGSCRQKYTDDNFHNSSQNVLTDFNHVEYWEGGILYGGTTMLHWQATTGTWVQYAARHSCHIVLVSGVT